MLLILCFAFENRSGNYHTATLALRSATGSSFHLSTVASLMYEAECEYLMTIYLKLIYLCLSFVYVMGDRGVFVKLKINFVLILPIYIFSFNFVGNGPK